MRRPNVMSTNLFPRTLHADSFARAEGSASDEAHPSEENQRADERGH